MKKITLLIILLIIVAVSSGCATKQINTDVNSITHTKLKKEIEIVYYGTTFTPGAGDDKGYYYVKIREDGSSNIKYINYENASEIYLCNRVECQHNDNTCNSWRPYTSGQHEVYLDNGQLYIMHTGANEEQMSKAPQSAQGYISVMDLSGSNEKKIYVFENLMGSTYMSSAVFSAGSIYVITQMTEKKENIPKTDFYLASIDKNKKNETELLKLDFNNPSVIGVKNNKFIILDIDVSDDVGPAFTVYSLDITTKDIKKVYSWDNKVCFGRLHNGEFYLFNRITSMVSHIDIETGKETPLVNASVQETIAGISAIVFIENFVVGATYNDDGTGQMYMINLETKSISYPNIEMETETPSLRGNIMQIVSTYEDKFIVASEIYYDLVSYPLENGQTIKMQKLQYKYGMINKEDYINNINTCTPLEMIE